MVKYQKYAEYKDSGVEWLGEIPNSWQVKKLKYLCKVTTGNKDTVNAVEDGKYPFFVRSQTVERINSIGADCEAVLTAGDGVGVGKVYHYYKGKFDFHQRVYMLYDFGDVIGRFVYYYLSSNFYKVALEGNAKSTVDSLRLPQFLNFAFSLPTIKEQDWIVDFLDHETTKIDHLIEKQKKLIELLKEKRQAVISHAVTKGLDPNVPMKDSGVEWLGQVPEHWRVVKLSYKLKLLSGDGITAFDIEDTGMYPVFGGNGLRGFTEKYNCDGEYALIGRQGALCGNINVARGKFFATEHAVVVYPYEKFNLTYLSELLRFMNLGQYSVSAAQPGIAVDRINALPIVIPTLDEQNAIGDFLDQETAKIDSLIAKQKKQIELMQERRTALISAAVTGKIDVRNWQAPNVAEAHTEFSA